MFRGAMGMTIIALVLLVTGVAVAQDGANIMVGDQIVARVRDAGTYESIEARAAAIHQAIQTACAQNNPATAEVSLKQVDELWTVFIGETRIMSVLPAEVAANGMASAPVLGGVWVDKFKQALPGMGNVAVLDLSSPLGDQPATTTPEPATPPTPAPAPTDTAEVLEIPVEGPTQPSVAAAQGARLLIIDAFNKTRSMDEDTYLRSREQTASGLLDNLLRVWSGGQHGSPDEPELAVPETGVSTISVLPGDTTATPPATTTVEEIPLGPSTGTVTVVDSGPAAPPVTTTTTTTTVTPPVTTSDETVSADIPSGDPSYARVPQKQRIGKKFAAARDPYLQLKATDAEAAKQVNAFLSAARREFSAKSFDLSEEYLDGALKMLGVTSW